MWGISGTGRKDKFKVNAAIPALTCSISFLLSDPADFPQELMERILQLCFKRP